MDRSTNSETGKEEEIRKTLEKNLKEIDELDKDSVAAFDKLYQVIFGNAERTKDGGLSLDATSTELASAFSDFAMARTRLHMKGVEFTECLIAENRKFLERPLDKMEKALRSAVDMTLTAFGAMHQSSMASFGLLFILGKAAFAQQTPAEDTQDVLVKLKKFREELTTLKESKGMETASTNMLIWENWKKRGIL